MRTDPLRFQFLDLLRGVAVVSLPLARMLLFQIVSRSTFKVITARSTLVLIFLAPTNRIQLSSNSSDTSQVPFPVRPQVGLLREGTKVAQKR